MPVGLREVELGVELGDAETEVEPRRRGRVKMSGKFLYIVSNSFSDPRRPDRPPAMAAGLTGHVRSLSEWIRFSVVPWC